jgi:Tfp pilus assembly protein PilF
LFITASRGFDEALKELRKAIEINPNSATAHNYLGITASQKGRQKEGRKGDASSHRKRSGTTPTRISI